MSTFTKKSPTREEIIAEIRMCAKNVGHMPSVRELRQQSGISRDRLRRMFGNYKLALEEAGYEVQGPGYHTPVPELVQDWAGVVRKLGRIPLREGYPGKFSIFPLIRRFGGGWTKVPGEMQKYIVKNGLERDYQDVLEVIAKYQSRGKGVSESPQRRWQPVKWEDRPYYGAPMGEGALACEPLSEAAVLVLFGAVARDLGFSVKRVQERFPDCEALCEVEPGKWQDVRIEFELFSSNFLDHEHDASRCDLIVCWEHDWSDCPLPVLALKTEVKRLAAEAARRAQIHTADDADNVD